MWRRWWWIRKGGFIRDDVKSTSSLLSHHHHHRVHDRIYLAEGSVVTYFALLSKVNRRSDVCTGTTLIPKTSIRNSLLSSFSLRFFSFSPLLHTSAPLRNDRCAIRAISCITVAPTARAYTLSTIIIFEFGCRRELAIDRARKNCKCARVHVRGQFVS